MLGDELADRCASSTTTAATRLAAWCGVYGDGVPVWLNRHWVDADVRITTGFVEPHFFAGFSGGPKLVAPGLAGLETVLTLHDATRIGDPRATWGVCEGNPVHDDVRAIAAGTGVDFAFDVILNRDQRDRRGVRRESWPMHAAARERVRGPRCTRCDGVFDVVVTSNSGYPLDQNLYQAVKGMSAAAEHRQAGRPDHLRGRVRATDSPTMARSARCWPAPPPRSSCSTHDRRPVAHRTRPVAGADPGPAPDQRPDRGVQRLP